MKVYDVDSEEYLKSGEFEGIIDFLIARRQERAVALAAKYSGYTIRPRYRDWETDRKSTRLNSSHRL